MVTRFFRWLGRQILSMLRFIFRRYGWKIAGGAVILGLWAYSPEIILQLALIGVMIFALRGDVQLDVADKEEKEMRATTLAHTP